MTIANSYAESRNLPSNTRTEPESDRLKLGFSGFTRATRPVSSRAIGILRIRLRSQGGGIPRPTYSSSCVTGCAMVRRESGFLSSTISDARFLLDAYLDIQGQPGNSDSRASKLLREYITQS